MRFRLLPTLIALSFLAAAAWWYALDLVARIIGSWYRRSRPVVDPTAY